MLFNLGAMSGYSSHVVLYGITLMLRVRRVFLCLVSMPLRTCAEEGEVEFAGVVVTDQGFSDQQALEPRLAKSKSSTSWADIFTAMTEV